MGYELTDIINFTEEPRLVEWLTSFEICEADCGFRHSIVLTTCGKVFTWGDSIKRDFDWTNLGRELNYPKLNLYFLCGFSYAFILNSSSSSYHFEFHHSPFPLGGRYLWLLTIALYGSFCGTLCHCPNYHFLLSTNRSQAETGSQGGLATDLVDLWTCFLRGFHF